MESTIQNVHDISDISHHTNLSPPTPIPVHGVHSRQAYRRQQSSSTEAVHYHTAPTDDEDMEDLTDFAHYQNYQGLGISGDGGRPRRNISKEGLPMGARAELRPENKRKPIMSASVTPEPPTPNFSQATTEQNTPERFSRGGNAAWDTGRDGRLTPEPSRYSPYLATSETDMLNETRGPHLTGPGVSAFECPTERAIVGERCSWLPVSILVLAIYSTIFSAVFLILAIARPRYGKRIGTQGHMSSSTASLLSALFSKTVELSFVTVFVAFLGQVLSRRAFQTKARTGGISIAEMSMRTWIMQPGVLITHWEGVRYAALTMLGMIALTAALVAMFYTTAAEALVAPKLRFGPLEHKIFGGKVVATFANPLYLSQTCATPIATSLDPTDAGTTCLQIEHAGQAYHNYQLYINGWAEKVYNGNVSAVTYEDRPPPIGLLYDNTTVQGQWILKENMTADSVKHKRLIQNITVAMPHSNVMSAVNDPLNDVLQPQELNGNGEYLLSASVPAPAVNIFCAGMTGEELAPLIYVTWPHSNGTFNVSTWPTSPPDNIPKVPDYPNATVVDDLFSFGKDRGQRAPIFPKLPQPYNTLVNGTGQWPANAIYLLAAPPPSTITAPYLFCSLKAMQYPNCTTRYRAAKAGGELSVHCDDDPRNTIPYARSQPAARSGNWETDWKNIASEWANSLSLGNGIADGAASNARLLTQMIPAFDNNTTPTALDGALPSIGEALGVLAGCTLLMSGKDAPFIHYWNYSTHGGDGTMLQNPQYQMFNVSFIYQDFASGGTQRWQGLFYVVLVAVFLTNVFCLVYLSWSLRNEGQLTDYTEPQNLFALAVNSPPSKSLSGACGGGPEGDMLSKKWQVDMQRHASSCSSHPHFYVKCPDDDRLDAFSRVRERRSRMSARSMEDMDVDDSPAVTQYMKLSSRKPIL